MALLPQKGVPGSPVELSVFGSRQISILVVDDNLEFLKLSSLILRRAGYAVLTAENGCQALDIIHERAPDLVVLDVVLPDISGIEICQKIKADPVLCHVFVILISGKAISANQTVNGLAIGADEYLFKPVAPSEFLARVRTMVRLMQTTLALGARELHYRRLLEILPDAVALIDPQSRLKELNQQAAAMLGYTGTGELLGESIFAILPPADHARFRAATGALEPGLIANGEYALLRRDQSWVPVEMSVTWSQSPEGEDLGLVVVARDITERKRVEAELRRLPQLITAVQEAERLRVARELHDGVNQVIASATMRLRRVQAVLELQNPALNEILSRCHQLLLQALEENRRIAHNMRPNDLDELGLGAACRNLCQQFETRTGLEVKCELLGLERKLSQEVDLCLFRIVQEALTNVEKHARAKVVRLSLSVMPDSILLQVQDDGCGFTALDRKLKKSESAGVGLDSMLNRATSLGGTSEVAPGPNGGTTVTVRLPLTGS